jgi:3-deoxy-D-manno-octulosonic-acid transferase
VGEGLQALPVIKLLRAKRPETQLAYTFFSPSAESFAATVGADFQDYLPFDTASDSERALRALRPAALVFSKLDVWPLLVETASRKGVKLGMLSATMPASSLRHSAMARLVLGDAYTSFAAVGAVSDDDAMRLIAAGVPADRVTVTGDTRYDQAWQKAEETSSDREALLAPLRGPRFTMVAGSTWPSDEDRLLPAWLAVRAAHRDTRLIIAPHELSLRHLEAIESWSRANSISTARIGEPEASTADVVVVDRYRILGDLYALADIAYVGGGFRSAGLHSLLEPAAYGSPVIIGPRHEDNRDARLLIAAGGAFRCENASAIESRIRRWIDTPVSLSQARTAAREVVRSGLGAAERSVELVEGLLT